jgi:hypothetical protein
LALAGYPDVLTASTVVQLVKQQIQVVVPTTGAGTVTANANWDCSIALFPNIAQSNLSIQQSISTNGFYSSGTSTTGNNVITGGLSIAAGPQGNQLWPTAATPSPTASYTSLNPISYIKGQGRVIAMGFEVVNTTAEINKQGQVTTWRLPTKWSPSVQYTTFATTPTVSVQQNVSLQRFPPATVAQAQQLFGSRSWAASEGGYVVSRQNSEANPALIPSQSYTAYSLDDNQSGGATSILVSATPNSAQALTSDYLLPYDISGLHFSGLSYTTALTVNVRWFFERIPGPLETDLVVLATPSAPYDPLALELYCSCLREMPPGVMLKENPLGEWFSNALSKVASVAAPLGRLVGNFIPGAAALGSAIGGGASLAQQVMAPSRPSTMGSLRARSMPIPIPQQPRQKKQKQRPTQQSNQRISAGPPQQLSDSRSHAYSTPRYR